MLSLVLAVLTQAPQVAVTDTALPPLQLTVDSARKEVHLTVGPFTLPPMGHHDDPDADHSKSHDTPVYQFAWPVDGWFRGFRVTVRDSAGRKLPRKLLHHLVMINHDRRQLLYSAAERLWGVGTETGNVSLPATVGVPLDGGTRLGMYVAWHNGTSEPLDGVYLEAVMRYLPENLLPRPKDVLPVYFDVNLTVGGGNEFDLVPGQFTQAYEFTVPVRGRLLAASGHLHDYGMEVRLEEAETGKVIARIPAKRRPDGRLRGMGIKLYGVAGEGVRLEAGKRYRVVAAYDNPTDRTLINGAMGSIVGIFAPDDLSRWPAIDPEDPGYKRDLRFLARRGGAMRREARARAEPAAAEGTEHQHGHEH